VRELPDPPVGLPGTLDPQWPADMIASPECVYYKILLGDRIVGAVIVAADAEKHPRRAGMARKRYRTEEIIAELPEAEVLTKGRNRECSTKRLHSALG